MSRVALVTGGTRGIGAAISIALKAAGYRVIDNYAGNDAAAEAFAVASGIPAVKWSVADYNACAEGVKRVEAQYGPVEILVNNAGITRDAMFHKMTPEQWREVIDKMYLPVASSGLIEQFDGYFQRRDLDLQTLEPRTKSVQEIFGIEGENELQIIKQPDVLMLQYLLRSDFSDADVRVNYDYYAPRTDYTFGSSLGPSIMAIMTCDVGDPERAYEHFMRAARADLQDVRGNAGDGIHAASAAGLWQALVFGFAGLRLTADGWRTQPQLPNHWTRLAFKFFWRGQWVVIDLGAT